jgi:superfamily II RNA helicase
MPFELDPFQKEAIGWIEKEHSLLVSAPTGAGKTVIAEYAIEKAFSRNEQVIYTSPIKALSNQKYRDFRSSYGEERVGILTGDVSINPDAPILIMTTEIYRNSLFENLDRIRKVGWVIFDEVHYLDDPERGSVWEEAILFTPPEIRILALSATVPNVRQLSEWIRSVHERPITVIEETHRPVPLHFLFQCQGKIMQTMKQLRQEGYSNRENWRVSQIERRRGVQPLRAKPNRLDALLRHLIEKDALPAIYFIFGRRRAEFLAQEAAPFDLLNPEEHKKICELYQSLLDRYDLTHERTAIDLRPLVERGIAYHHAGMLPTLKEVVEQLFTSRFIKMIFTTETFALGINMPARSVIFDELVKFYGTHFRNLTTRDFYQMAGRAGRRGMDREGFVYVRIHPNDISYTEVQRILFARPESIRSQWNTTYATLLNLYRDLGRGLLDIYPRSFHNFQASKNKRKEGYQMMEQKLTLLEVLGYLTSEGITAKGEFAASLFGYELILAEIHEEGILDQLNVAKLNMLLSALVFEPRRADHLPRLTAEIERLAKGMDYYLRRIHKMEFKYRISPYTKPTHFHLAPAMEAWTRGESFDKLFRLTSVDEGELVRYFRMVIQLLRELLHAPYVSDRLRATAHEARKLINRDVVDAEKQLRC